MDQARDETAASKRALAFPPDPEGPERVARRVIATLAALPFVRNIALFGSLAEGRADCWSDVDLCVACDDVERTQWMAASAIRAAALVKQSRLSSSESLVFSGASRH